jgi:aspartyl-tRNA(Asn)/glutamyl-tRNA(Gln) amidotransferase subunit A
MTGEQEATTQRSTAQIAFAEAVELVRALDTPEPKVGPPLELRLPTAPDPVGQPSAEPAAPYPVAHRASTRPPLVTRPLTDAPTLVQAQGQLRSGRTSAKELVEAALAAAEADTHGAMVALDPDRVRAEAARCDEELANGQVRGPLHGIPITVKDVIDAAGYPTAAGSDIYFDRPERDAAAVMLLRDAGAIVIGKAATHEFALGVTTPQCTNPYDASRIAGGSSGGSAIALATGIGLGSLGTDTRASLRVPAAMCGVVGFKPTWGRVPTTGIVPLSWTLDHIGPIAATVADAGVMMDVLLGVPPTASSPGGGSVEGLVVGVAARILAEAEPEVAAVVDASLSALERIGCRLVTVDVPDPDDLAVGNAIGMIISRAEAATFHRSRHHDLDRCIPEVRDQLKAALDVAAVDYLDAQRERARLAARSLAVFDQCDVVLTPTIPVVAPRSDEYEAFLMRLSRNPLVWGLIGTPALSMPAGFTPDGLPVGLQLAARPFAEDVLVSVGTRLERELATGW